jgi:dTDP-4-amino-4,6-dideoxygalactose transaminase
VDPHTWTLDPSDVERRITPRTRAILGVHLYGNPCDVEGLEAVARKHGLKLIYDAAHAFGSEWRGRPIGQFGDAEVFSFTPTKMLVCGEGGLVATNDASLAHRIRAGRNYGDLGQYDPELLGLNARMQGFAAAMGVAGLRYVDDKVARHNQIAHRYESALRGLPGISYPVVRDGDLCTYKDFSIHVDAGEFGMTRDELAAELLGSGVETKLYFYPPLHGQNLYKQEQNLPVTERIGNGVLSLPIYQSLPDEDVDRIISAVTACATEARG